MNRTMSRTFSSRAGLGRTKSTKGAMNAVQLMIAMQLIKELAKRTSGATARNRSRVGRPGPNRAQMASAARRRR